MKNFREIYNIEKGESSFSLKMPSSDTKTFMLDKNGEMWVDMVRADTYYYCGEVIEIGRREFEQAIVNFEEGLTNGGVKKDLLFDYDHDYMYTKAAGWINAIKISDDGKRLLGKVDWSAAGKASIEGDEYRYTSVEFSNFYYKEELFEGEKVEVDKGFTLFACTLTNRPFVKGMERVALSEKNTLEKEDNLKDNKNKEPIGGLMKFEEKYNELVKKFDESLKTVEETNKNLETVQKENEELKGKIALSEKNSQFDAMLKENKAVEAQREHFLSGDMKAFAEAFIVVPTKEAGTSEEDNGEEEAVNFSELATKLAKEKNIIFSEALKIVKREQNKEGK